MVVSEGAINNIMGGMENTTGVRLHSHRHKLKQRFDIVRKLGQGTYGKVQLALNKETKQQVAIKTIKKAKIETEQDLVRIRREIQIMSSVQHPQIIHIYEVFENREKMVLVMEYAAGGELYDYLSERKVLPEEEARRIFRQVASAVYYCHKHKICHRDLKLENILLDSDGNAKIADFGLSNVFDEKQRLDTFCGSPLYASPEIVKGVPYVGPEVDCWSLGVLLYTLVYGAMPFDGSNFRRLVKQITQGDFYEPSTPANASDLIRQMLTVQSTERANIADICNHWWVNEGYSECCLTLAEDLANQTPVRLDLLLSLVPKHISSEHMLIQPEDEDISQKSDSERGPPDLKIPPPPALDDESQMEPVPVRSHSLGAVLPSGGVSVDLLLEKKKKEREKKKKESTSKKPPSRPTNEEERKSKKKEDKLEEEKEKKKVKRVDSPSEREKEKIKKRDISNDREKAKKRERSSEREKLRKRDSSGERAKIRKKDASEEDLKKISEPVISKEEEKGAVKKADSGISLKTSVKKEKEEPVTSSKFSAKETEVEEEKVIDDLSSTQVKESKSDIKEVPKSLSSKSVSKSLSKSETSEKRSVTKKSSSKVGLVAEDEKDTEKILKETAAKIEKAESFIKKEEELVSPVSSSPLTSPVMSPPVTSPLVSSQNSSFATSPVRSRTGSESSTEAGRQTKSESSSRRQSKIFSKAALFEPSLSPQHSKSPPPQTDKPKKITTRPGALNMSDLTKKFEDKSSTEKKNKVVTPFKVSDTRKTFENKVEKSTPESSKQKTSVNSIGEVGQSSLKDSHPASPTKGDKSLVNSLGKASVPVTVKVANKSSRETSPTKKLSKSPTKESPPKDVSLVKKERSPKKESSPVKTVPKPVSKISSFSKPKEEAPKEKKIEPPSEEIISKGKEAITTTKKVSEPRIPPTAKFDTSDSSESESEAEKMLRELSVKREKLEIAKKEKLKKVSEGKEAQISQNNISIMREDSSTATPAAHESSSSITSQPESRDQKYATLPRGFKSKTDQAVSHKPKVPLPKTSSIEESNSSEPVRKKSQVEIVLQTQNKQPTSHLDQGKRSSLAETQPQPSRSQFRTEIQRSIGTPEPKGPPPEPQLQRARRERIIPIMLEDDTTVNEYNNKMATSSRSSMVQPSSSSSSRNSSVSSVPRTIGFVVTPLSSTVNSTATADRKMNPSPPEPIRKSRRERIIPIAVEGEGLLTPPISESKSSEKVRPYQRQGSRGRGFTLDRAESFSSAGEDEEDEEDDGFQILTAESLFSTLLSRVRSLTRKMGEDGGRGSNIASDRLKRGPLQPGINSDTPSSTGSSGTQSGFWSSLYSPPRDLPGRTIPISRGQSREEDPFSVLGPPLWERSLSRNTSDSDSVFSEPSGPFSTLPRGWRARRSARDERLVEGDEGFASFTPSRRQFYSRTLSRDLPLKTSSEDFQRTGSRNSWDASTSSGTIPRTGTATGSTIPTQFNQESSNKLASKSSISDPNNRTMRESNNNPVFRERPLSATGSTMSSGEAFGRVGGHFEQHKDKSSASFKSDKEKQESNTGKQSVQQLKDLVSELESVTEENSDAREKSSKANVAFLTTNVKCPLQSPKPSKSFTSLQMQQHNLINQSNSNPNIVFSITITPRNQQLLSKNMISSNASYKETNKGEKNSKEYGLSDTLINSHDDNQHDTISSKKTPKNTFTPYSPNSSSVGKNAIFNKQRVSDTTKVSNDIKSEKVADNQSVPLSKVNEVEKTKDLELHSEKSTENIIKTGTNLPSYLKSNDTFKVENKHLLNVEPYRRGRSEDLKVAIDLANSSSSSTVDSGRSIKPYKKSKSRDITPTIEAASERFTQLNSGNLRKISPFEAYRRSKSKELSSSIDIVNNSTENRMRSPPPTSDSTIKSDSSMSQFEKARTSIEKKFEKAKSPPIELETTIKEVPNSPLLPQESKDDTTNESEKEKQSKEIKESDKPKSVYKILTTKFTRSLSNLGEDKQDKSQNRDNTEENDKEEKFKLKRPSIFMKKMEKSSSKTSIAETENKDDDTDKNDKKSNKLSYALNKFLGRKPEDTSSKLNKNDTLIAPKKSTSVVVIPEKVKKPPRFRTKKFSKSQENLNQGNEDEDFDHETRSKSVFPDSEQTTEVEDKNKASKETNSHLSQIEIKITPTINNTIHSYDSKPKVSSSQNTNYSPSIASYGLSPALINKRLSSVHSNSSDRDLSSPQTELDIGSKKKLGHEFTEERSITPIESSPSGLEDIKEAEDESVMDRITRKSYYSRFNEMKRKPKPKRIDSRETMDQQLAAAKARLMQEESREAASSSRMTPQRTFTSISPPLILDGVIRRPSKGTLPRTISLPPDDGFVGGSRNSPFNNQEETFKSMRYQSSEREPVGFYRSNSITREEQKPYRRQLSTNLDEAYSNHKRLSSVSRDDPPFFLKQPSIPRDDEPPTFRLPSVVKDEPPSYRRLSAALRDEPQLRDSSLTKDESFSYNKMPSTSLRDGIKDKRQPSIPRDSFGHRRSLSRDFSNQHKNNETHISTINSPTNGFQQKTKDSDNSSENYEKSDAFAAANAAGKAAGEAAAAAVAVSPTQRIPSSLSNISASDPDAVKSAREELTRRLTPLTRLSSLGSGESRPYRRTVTSGNLPLNQFSTNKTSGLERPYRRTTTTDLPPLDSRIRTNELRRFQEPSRRFSGIRSVENGIDSKPSPAMLSPSNRSPYSSYVTPTSSISPFQSPPSMNTILRRTSLYRY